MKTSNENLKYLKFNFDFDPGVAHNGLEQIDVNGYDLLIIGAGPIGLLAASVAKALGKEGKKERKTPSQKIRQTLKSSQQIFKIPQPSHNIFYILF
jgi:hypothetical protein